MGAHRMVECIKMGISASYEINKSRELEGSCILVVWELQV